MSLVGDVGDELTAVTDTCHLVTSSRLPLVPGRVSLYMFQRRARCSMLDTRNPGQQTDNEGVMDGFLCPGRSARLVTRRDTDTSPELRRGGLNTEKLVTAYN